MKVELKLEQFINKNHNIKCINYYEVNMDLVKRPEKPKKDDLVKLYDVCNKIFKNKNCFYTNEEFKKSKEKIEI